MIERLLSEIENPAQEYTIAPFWFLNDNFFEEKLKKQISDFKSKGVYCFVIHPRIGLPKSIGYLSEAFFKYIKIIIETAKENGMTVILYDEGMYPSGSASGLIAKENPELKSKGLFLSEVKEGRIIAHTPAGYLTEKNTEGRLRGIHFDEDDYGKNQPYSADILNEEAVDKFIELTHENYYRRFKEHFGKTIIGIFTDEADILGRGPRSRFAWTKGLEDEIVEKGGKLEELTALFFKEENQTTRIYRQVVLERELRVYYKRIHDWCRAHNILFLGHPSYGYDIETLTEFDVPGQDIVFRFVSPDTSDLDGFESVCGKITGDVADILGLRRNLNEYLGVCSKEKNQFHLPVKDIKWYTDYLAVRGVNMFIPHAFYYSMRGARKFERPPDVGLNTLWWKHYKKYADYVRRVSYLMTDSVNCAVTAVLCTDKAVPYEEVKYLYQNQIEFNYLPVNMLDSFKIKDGCLTNGKNTYRYFLDFIDANILNLKQNKYEDITSKFLSFKNYHADIRIRHFIKEGCECVFLTNAGKKSITDTVKMQCTDKIVLIDLWRNEKYRLETKQKDGCSKFKLSLNSAESVLLVIDKEGKTNYPKQCKKQYLELDFTLKKHEKTKFKKHYAAHINIDKVSGSETVKVKADETVEYIINGKFAGVSFWNPHECNISAFLKKGKNIIELIITGNTANKHGDTEIPYGILN